ncbi:MAG TPA: Ig-like domain-containing protein, partial [Anaerolineaceae bacterium]|nr:Ig-like domain-containing protein [Anaerolineaceae bacterium]
AATNVKPSGSSITISASSSSVLIGSPVRLEITLNALPPGSGVPTGTVTLEPVELGARETSSSLSPPAAFPIINGTPSILLQSLTLGEHRFQVSYSGDSFFTPSRSPVVSIQVEPHHWFIPFLTQTEEVSNRFLQD